MLVVRRGKRRAELRSNTERRRSAGVLAPALGGYSEGGGAGAVQGDSEPTIRYCAAAYRENWHKLSSKIET